MPKKPKSLGAIVGNSSQAVGPYWGFSLQSWRMLQLLLLADPGSFVSLEVFEDVGKVDGNGNTLASQTKSALGANPISDRSVDLWKTFANWHDAVIKKSLDPSRTTFEIYLGRKHTAPIAEVFSHAKTLPEATVALAVARKKLWGSSPAHDLRKTQAVSLEKYLNRFLQPDDDISIAIVAAFCLTVSASTIVKDVHALIGNFFIPPHAIEDVLIYMLGYVKLHTDTNIVNGQSAIISKDDFYKDILAYIPRVDYTRILRDFAGAITTGDLRDHKLQTYVQQLEIIEKSDEDVLEAINQFLKASISRSRWAEDGVVHRDSLEAYARSLKTYWKNVRIQNALTHRHLSSVQLGQLLLASCLMRRETVQGLEVSDDFIAGSYHTLADNLEVGWHPEYKTTIEKTKT